MKIKTRFLMLVCLLVPSFLGGYYFGIQNGKKQIEIETFVGNFLIHKSWYELWVLSKEKGAIDEGYFPGKNGWPLIFWGIKQEYINNEERLKTEIDHPERLTEIVRFLDNSSRIGSGNLIISSTNAASDKTEPYDWNNDEF